MIAEAPATLPDATDSPMSAVVLLGDLDALIREVGNPACRARLRKLGFELEDSARLVAARGRVIEVMERRWMLAYERAFHRYGRAVVPVRDRVCSGCFVTLPTVARPRAAAQTLHVCQSCGRILYWT